MITVADIWEQAKDVFGTCEDRELYRGINAAVDMLVNKGDWTPMMAYVDVVVAGQTHIALPSEVETPLGISVDGHPMLSQDELYRFHINGPGEIWHPSGWHWENNGASPVMQQPPTPSKLRLFVESPGDKQVTLRVFGYDENGSYIRTDNGDGTYTDGYAIGAAPIDASNYVGLPQSVLDQLAAVSVTAVDAAAPTFARIVEVEKSLTAGRIRLGTSDWDANGNGTLLGDYLPGEVDPSYRLIRLSQKGTSARIYFRRKTLKLLSQTDFIPLDQTFAIELAMRAVQAYRNRELSLAMGFESNAARLLSEREHIVTPPGASAPQMDVRTGIVDNDYDDFYD
jgi:hypothetical protein